MTKINKKNKTKNKIFEFLTVFSMVFGIVVGSGIYLKNSGESGVLAMAGNNPWVALAVWTLMGVFCCLMMLTFIEVSSSSKKGEHNTLTSWSGRFVGRRYGSLVTILYAIIYMPVLVIIGSLFTTSSFFDAIKVIYESNNGIDSWDIFIKPEVQVIIEISFATVLLVGFQLMNIYSEKPGRILQTILSFLKFVPLLVVLIAGIVFFAEGNDNSFNPTEPYESFSVNTFFATMVPIMFAFDGFLDSAAIQKDCEHKEVVAPAMMSGIVAVSIFYIIISAAIFMGASDGNILDFFSKNAKADFAFKLIITLTLLTMVNAYSVIYPLILKSSIEEKFVYSKNRENSELSRAKSGYIALAIVFIFFIAFVSSSLAITKGKSYLETSYLSSDTSIILVYLIYIPIIISVLKNRKTKKIDVKPIKGGYVTSIISVSMLIFMMLYIYYLNIIKALIDGNLLGPIMWFIFVVIITVVWIVNEAVISFHDIKNNDFYLRLNPKNWFNYDKQNAIDKFKNKKEISNDKGFKDKQS